MWKRIRKIVIKSAHTKGIKGEVEGEAGQTHAESRQEVAPASSVSASGPEPCVTTTTAPVSPEGLCGGRGSPEGVRSLLMSAPIYQGASEEGEEGGGVRNGIELGERERGGEEEIRMSRAEQDKGNAPPAKCAVARRRRPAAPHPQKSPTHTKAPRATAESSRSPP